MKRETFEKLFIVVVIIAIIMVFVFTLTNRESITKHEGESISETKDSLINETKKAKKVNAEKMADAIRERKYEKWISGRSQVKTSNYIIIDISMREDDLSANEIQYLFDGVWELIAMSDRRYEVKRYVFKKIEGGKK